MAEYEGGDFYDQAFIVKGLGISKNNQEQNKNFAHLMKGIMIYFFRIALKLREWEREREWYYSIAYYANWGMKSKRLLDRNSNFPLIVCM